MADLTKLLFCSYLVCIAFVLHAQSTRLLDASDGLSSSFVFDMMQASDGSVYIGTKSGLNIYDGYNMRRFSHDPYDSTSISITSINQIEEDRRGYIWISFENGALDVFNPRTERFYHLGVFGSQGTEYHKAITHFIIDPNDNIWLGIENGDILKVSLPSDLNINNYPAFIPDTTFLAYKFQLPLINNPAASNQKNKIVKSLFYLDAKEHLWLLSNKKQLLRIDWNKNTWKLFYQEANIIKGPRPMMFESADNKLYFVLDSLWYQIKDDSIQVTNLHPIITNYTTCKFHHSTPSGRLLLGNHKPTNSLDFLQIPNKHNWEDQSMSIDTLLRTTHGTNDLSFVDKTGLVWINNEIGITLLNTNKNQFSHIAKGHSAFDLSMIGDNYLAYRSKKNTHLIDINTLGIIPWQDIMPNLNFEIHSTCHNNGVELFGFKNPWENVRAPQSTQRKFSYFRFNINTKEVSEFDLSGFNLTLQSTYDHAGRLWVFKKSGTFGLLNSNNELSFETKVAASDGLIRVEDFTVDYNNNIWIATTSGFIMTNSSEYPENELSIQVVKNDPKNKNSLSFNWVKCFHEDPIEPNKYMWIGTAGGGLNRYHKTDHSFDCYSTENSNIPNDVIYQIQADDQQNLWLSTNRGLSKFNLQNQTFTNYTVEDGLQSYEFNTNSSAKLPDGRLAFGGINGITLFDPKVVKTNYFGPLPEIRLTELKVNNEVIGVKNNRSASTITLNSAIAYTKEIDLAFDQNTILLEFSIFDFTNPNQNQYKYKLTERGLIADKESNWTSLGTTNHVQFTSLNPGVYVFQVHGSGPDGRWSKIPAKLTITIRPPWWKTNFAYLIYSLLFFGLLYRLYRFQIKRAKLENELAFEHKEAERLKQLDEIKTNFFSNITHEFRTPLTLILEPIRQLLASEAGSHIEDKLTLVQNNSEKLLHLVNQLLDISKLEAGKMTVNPIKVDVFSLLSTIVASFEFAAKQKGISLNIINQSEIDHIHIDKFHFEKICFNLISNAIKFTEGGGITITLTSDIKSNMLTIAIQDSGIGIPQESQQKVFDRFYQDETDAKKSHQGTGIGLALTKELTELMGGSIELKSERGKGSTFSVFFPTTLKPNDTGNTNIPNEPNTLQHTLTSHGSANNEITEAVTYEGKPIILLIEDHHELRQFVKQSIAAEYNVIEALNGEEGIEKATKEIPDLIISDVSMPKKDGFEVLQELKGDIRTSHIPIVLLTAKSATESKLQGLRFGADDYLTKPFNTEELILRITNLITIRNQLQHKFSGSLTSAIQKSTASELSKIDKSFLESITNTVELHLENQNLTVEFLAKEVYMSRVHLFRKVKAITNMTPTEFIRNFRLDRAKSLLESEEMTVLTAALSVGFGNEKYFSRKFKERFGVSPSKIRQKQ